jgi:mono/diheme cytochrome c family protein
MVLMRTSLLILFLALAVEGCRSDSNQKIKAEQPTVATRGKRIYMTNCAACHNTDPSKDGSLGPAIQGSSQELLEAKVLRAAYPPSYTPKRKTSSMPAFPNLKSAIPNLAAYISVQGSSKENREKQIENERQNKPGPKNP